LRLLRYTWAAPIKQFNSLFSTFGQSHHGKKGFVIPTKSFVKIGITKQKYFMLQQQNVWFYQLYVWLPRQNFWLQQQKFCFFVPNFVAVTKPFLP